MFFVFTFGASVCLMTLRRYSDVTASYYVDTLHWRSACKAHTRRKNGILWWSVQCPSVSW